MTDNFLLTSKIRRLSIALTISSVINIGVLALLSYSMIHERPPTPYCELKPANADQLQTPLADYRGSAEVIAQLSKLSFQQLVNRLNHTQLIENGYAERDLALACLASFYHFDVERAAGYQDLLQRRVFTWKNNATGENLILTVYPGMTNAQFNSIIQFAKTEQWPLTTEGLFLSLKKQKESQNIDPGLVETFLLTPDFWTVELLFNRFSPTIRKQKIMELLLEGNWNLFKQFVDQQRHLQDVSDARRQKFLLDYIKLGSESAAEILLVTDWDFATKKMDDAQVISLLQALPKKVDSERYAKEMLTSPRHLSVWQQASLRLYEYAGEAIPTDWNYKTSVTRFVPEKANEIPSSPIEKVVIKTEPSKSIPKEIKTVEKKPVIAKPIEKAKSPQYRLYIVQEGDSLWKISRRFGVDMEVLKERNQIQSSAIKPGTVLKIP